MKVTLVPMDGAREPVQHPLRSAASLAYPWRARCNPAAERAEVAAAVWVSRHGMLRDPATAARCYKKQEQ